MKNTFIRNYIPVLWTTKSDQKCSAWFFCLALAVWYLLLMHYFTAYMHGTGTLDEKNNFLPVVLLRPIYLSWVVSWCLDWHLLQQTTLHWDKYVEVKQQVIDFISTRITSIRKIYSATVYSYFMATRGPVKLLSRGSGEDLGNCCQRPKAEGNSFPDLLHYRGTMVWLFPK